MGAELACKCVEQHLADKRCGANAERESYKAVVLVVKFKRCDPARSVMKICVVEGLAQIEFYEFVLLAF